MESDAPGYRQMACPSPFSVFPRACISARKGARRPSRLKTQQKSAFSHSSLPFLPPLFGYAGRWSNGDTGRWHKRLTFINHQNFRLPPPLQCRPRGPDVPYEFLHVFDHGRDRAPGMDRHAYRRRRRRRISRAEGPWGAGVRRSRSEERVDDGFKV